MISDTAQQLRTYTIGNKENISATEYSWSTETRKITISVTDGCVPVFEKVTGTISGGRIDL